jgi:hypothetical protein
VRGNDINFRTDNDLIAVAYVANQMARRSIKLHDEVAVDMENYISSLNGNLTQATAQERRATHGFDGSRNDNRCEGRAPEKANGAISKRFEPLSNVTASR